MDVKQEALEDLIKLFQSDEVQLRRYMERSEWIRNEVDRLTEENEKLRRINSEWIRNKVDRLTEENKKLRRVNSELKSANELLQETIEIMKDYAKYIQYKIDKIYNRLDLIMELEDTGGLNIDE